MSINFSFGEFLPASLGSLFTGDISEAIPASLPFAFPIAIGLASSFTHCAGMCGPIHFMIAAKKSTNNPTHFYHAGRILGYTLIGLVLGLLGHTFTLLSTPQFRLGAGILLVLAYMLFGFGLLGWLPQKINFEKILGNLLPTKIINQFFIKNSNQNSNQNGEKGKGWIFFPAGMAASLLPCPSTHAVMLWALGMDQIWKSAFAMFILGVSTLPIFVLLSNKFFSQNTFSRKIFSAHWYRLALGFSFLGLSAWRIYGIAIHGPASCH